MNVKKNYSNEIKLIFKYITENLLDEYPSDKINSAYFIISIIETGNNIANEILSKYLMNSQIEEIKEQCYGYIASNSRKLTDNMSEINILESEIIKSIEQSTVSSDMLLSYLLNEDDFTLRLFKQNGISLNHIKKEVTKKIDTPKKHEKKQKGNKPSEVLTKNLLNSKKNEFNEVEKLLTNINKLAQQNKIDKYIGNEEIINSILRVMLKKRNNNVIIVGENGVGKTTLVKHLSNMITEEKISKPFLNKTLMEINFNSLKSGMMFKGAFESRIKNLIDDAKKHGNYIFFIDNLDSLMDNSPYGDSDMEMLLNNILNEDKIYFIATSSSKGYSKIVTNYNNLTKKIHKIQLNEPDEILTFKILKEVKEKYELHHDVFYTDDCLKSCIQLCKRYYNEYSMPNIAIDILDEMGAEQNLFDTDSKEIRGLKIDINNVLLQKQKISLNTVNKESDKIDELTKKEIKLKSLLSLAIKTQEMNKKIKTITKKDVCKFISDKVGIPLSQMEKTDKDKLKNINNVLKTFIIGQDEAVDEVCKVIKRQRLGLSNPNKPSVLLFTGSTGTGKTYLAKKIAEKIFGDEKYLVRFDMSEYSDKMASSKLIGSSAGYIGYENGGLLTEAIKNNKYCVLLLDECEKADDSVFNMFLQIFDEGRLTDNKGVTVDFKNVIVIMTSNTGAQEVSERRGGIGFHKDEESINQFEKAIYEKAIKRKFKPEFINRIDKIVYFNKLTLDDLKKIIKIEIDKVNDKLKTIGYSLHEDIYEPITTQIINNISKNTEYGARYILREIQTLLEDNITDILINKNIKKGHKFKYEEVINIY